METHPNRNRFIVLVCAVLVIANVATAEPIVRVRQSVVVAGHPVATTMGQAVLDAGGNAIDALVTVSLALGVAEPGNSGLGGKLVLLYYEASTGKVHALNALEAAPLGLDIEKTRGLGDERVRGWKSVATPGYPAALAAAHGRWGSMPWRDLVIPAADLAENGLVVTPLAAEMLSEFRGRHDEEAARIYMPEGATPAAGARFANPDLARTLRVYADRGASAFVDGPIVDAIVSAASVNDSPLSHADFAAYQPRFLEPLAIDWCGWKVYSGPPPLTGGATVLATLAVLEATGWPGDASPRDAAYIDTVGRALLAVYPEVARTAGDSPQSRSLVEEILSPDSVARLAASAKAMQPRAQVPVPLGGWRGAFGHPQPANANDDCTTHLVIIDRAGNVVCATQSLGFHFGAAVVAPGTGVLLNNSMNNLSYANPDGVNFAAPGKHPRSTMAPTLVLRDGRPVLVLGAPGGQRIPTAIIQVVVDALHFGRSLEDAVTGPRFHVRRATRSGEPGNMVDLDHDTDPAVEDGLKNLGWQVTRRGTGEFYFGAVNAAMYLPDGTILGVADQRRTGDAQGD